LVPGFACRGLFAGFNPKVKAEGAMFNTYKTRSNHLLQLSVLRAAAFSKRSSAAG